MPDVYAHQPGCKFRISATCPTAIECQHGYDVCPMCDPCTCGDPMQEPSRLTQQTPSDEKPVVVASDDRFFIGTEREPTGQVSVIATSEKKTERGFKRVNLARCRSQWVAELLQTALTGKGATIADQKLALLRDAWKEFRAAQQNLMQTEVPDEVAMRQAKARLRAADAAMEYLMKDVDVAKKLVDTREEKSRAPSEDTSATDGQ